MKIRIYKDKRGEWRWRMVARNGRTVADSGEGYVRRSNARRAAYRLVDALCLGNSWSTDGKSETIAIW